MAPNVCLCFLNSTLSGAPSHSRTTLALGGDLLICSASPLSLEWMVGSFFWEEVFKHTLSVLGYLGLFAADLPAESQTHSSH